MTERDSSTTSARRDFSRRRALAAGAAWTVPAAAVSVAAPAYAASSGTCNSASVQKIDAAFLKAEQQFFCNGKPISLDINFYQPVAAGNGYGTDAYVNVTNASSCPVTFSSTQPLNLGVRLMSYNDLSATKVRTGRGLTSVVTSWGTRTVNGGGGIGPQPTNGAANQVHHTINWAATGKLAAAGSGDTTADIRFGISDGAVSGQRWTNYLTVTVPTAQTFAPSLASIGLPNQSRCVDYYNKKLATMKSPINWTMSGPQTSNTKVPVQPGTVISSLDTGNASTGGARSKDGIW